MDKFYLKKLKSERLTSGIFYGEFVIENLKPGQGLTIGNQLRRILLGDLGGYAISAVRIIGTEHEFESIPGIREDVLELLLNLTGITVKRINFEYNSEIAHEKIEDNSSRNKLNSEILTNLGSDKEPLESTTNWEILSDSKEKILSVSEEEVTKSKIRKSKIEQNQINLKTKKIDEITKSYLGRIKVQGPVVINGSAIKLPKELEIVNPNHYIATISTSVVFEMEFKIEYGTGYKLASHLFSEDDENFLQIDTKFVPVQKVNFKIENIYNKENLVSERLFLEVWTNGSITPLEAIIKAARININLFSNILNSKKIEQNQKSKLKSASTNKKPYSNMPIEELLLSVRAYNCLKKASIDTVGDLLKYSLDQLYDLRNFGKKSADEVSSKLKNKLGIDYK